MEPSKNDMQATGIDPKRYGSRWTGWVIVVLSLAGIGICADGCKVKDGSKEKQDGELFPAAAPITGERLNVRNRPRLNLTNKAGSYILHTKYFS